MTILLTTALGLILFVIALAVIVAPIAFIRDHRIEARHRNTPPDQRVWKRSDWHIKGGKIE